MTERTYTEAEVRSLMFKAWDHGWGMPLENGAAMNKVAQRTVDRILRDHVAQPAPSPVEACQHASIVPLPRMSEELAQKLGVSSVTRWCPDCGAIGLPGVAQAKDPTPATRPGAEQPTCSTCRDQLQKAKAASQSQRDWQRAILVEYEDELTKEACDRCERCGPMVMCAFHSLLSLLSEHTQPTMWPYLVAERDRLKAQVEAQREQPKRFCPGCGRTDLWEACDERACPERHIARLQQQLEAQREQLEQLQLRIAVLEPGAQNYNPMRVRAEKAEQQLTQVTRERERYVAFIRVIMRSWPDGDMDGGELQELAHQHGILQLHAVTEPCGEGCQCASYGDFPTTCYRLTEQFRSEPSTGATK